MIYDRDAVTKKLPEGWSLVGDIVIDEDAPPYVVKTYGLGTHLIVARKGALVVHALSACELLRGVAAVDAGKHTMQEAIKTTFAGPQTPKGVA